MEARRDRSAHDVIGAADERDRQAEVRDRAAEARELGTGAPPENFGQHAIDRFLAGRDRDAAAADRAAFVEASRSARVAAEDEPTG